MNIGLDCDGVIYFWHMLVYNYVKMFPGTDETYEEFWKEINNGTRYSETFKRNLVEMDDMYNKLSADKDVVKAVNILSRGNSIYYITSIPDRLKRIREAWLMVNKFPQASNLITTFDKAYYVRDLEIDLMVEDRMDNILELSKYTRVVGIRQPWNEDLWDDFEFVDHITQLPEYLGVA